MGAHSLHEAAVEMDATVGATAVTNISSGVVGAVLNPSKNVGAHFTLGNRFEQQTDGGFIHGGTIRARNDESATSAWAYLYDAFEDDAGDRRTLNLYFPDTSAGSIKWTGEAVIVSANNAVNGSAGSGDAMITDFAFKYDGTVTRSVVGA